MDLTSVFRRDLLVTKAGGDVAEETIRSLPTPWLIDEAIFGEKAAKDSGRGVTHF